MIGAGAALYAAASWAFGSQLFGRVLAKHPELRPDAANLFKNALAATVFGLVWIVMGWSGPDGAAWWPLLLSGFLGFAAGDALYFAAFERCGVQLAALSTHLIPPMAAGLDFVLRGQRLTAAAMGCMLVTMGGIVIVTLDGKGRTSTAKSPTSGERWSGLGLAAVAAAVQSVAIVFGRIGFDGIESTPEDLLPGTTVRLIGGVAGAPVLALGLALVRRRSLLAGVRAVHAVTKPARTKHLALALLVPTLIAAVINLPAHSLALGRLPAATSAILFATTPLFTLPIGLAMGARYGRLTYLGTLVAFAGVAGVVLYSQAG